MSTSLNKFVGIFLIFFDSYENFFIVNFFTSLLAIDQPLNL